MRGKHHQAKSKPATLAKENISEENCLNIQEPSLARADGEEDEHLSLRLSSFQKKKETKACVFCAQRKLYLFLKEFTTNSLEPFDCLDPDADLSKLVKTLGPRNNSLCGSEVNNEKSPRST